MQFLKTLAILLGIALTAAAQDIQGDLAKLQGTWTAQIGPKKDLPLTWVVKGDKVTAQIKTIEGKDVTTKFTIKLDEKASPKALDQTKMRIDFGGDVGEVDADDSPAIYELKHDEWKVCLVPFGSPRPKSFVMGDSSDIVIFKKSDKSKPK